MPRRTPCNLVNPKKLAWQRRQAERERQNSQRELEHVMYLTPQERELKRNRGVTIFS